MELKDEIKRRRTELNLTMAGLARLVGTNKSTVLHWERGDLRPNLDSVMKLAEFFGITETELLHPKAEDEENEDSKNVQ
ncbi:MAG: helix-turn-helix transcriptional regulator [Synergistaceae bacterium]|nr:helix-turn-helix transcriptional regulator [Synergistaceae bacterium]